MNVRVATIQDAKGIARVHVDSWRTTYKGIVPNSFLENMSYADREERWKEMIPHHQVFVAENEAGEIVGFSSGGLERFGKYPDYQGEVYAIYILEQYQGLGLGTKLLEPIVQYLKENGINRMLVLVLAENSATYFYESLGAKRIGTEELEIAGKKLVEFVYGWEDLSEF
ncbi:GNAT family N-acetyltransferase [Ornithinibacillus halotolerans]|uniref:Acetyltransferase n=1 Tax=Ornithinibacillus halotolerans TaxID=1274357 RepID=A0A916RRC8_9BACI|nr:GNAT family N-acetyltransferase [Ornithinibacillus halotolerans]GGA64191.1 acetyltransferase [Ornithinibacillus halotolerans]